MDLAIFIACCYNKSMDLQNQIANFTAFARLLADQQGHDLTLDDAYQKWKEIEPDELVELQSRLRSYDEGERGRLASESMAELRSRLLARFGE